jgi:hypothetical protein
MLQHVRPIALASARGGHISRGHRFFVEQGDDRSRQGVVMGASCR